jgi:hypothetical protein
MRNLFQIKMVKIRAKIQDKKYLLIKMNLFLQVPKEDFFKITLTPKEIFNTKLNMMIAESKIFKNSPETTNIIMRMKKMMIFKCENIISEQIILI